MWIFTPGAFVSVVAHRAQPGHVLVRARRREDLERFLSASATHDGTAIEATPQADYPFRVTLSKKQLAFLAMTHALLIDYDNFKATPENRPRSGVLHQVWAAAQGLERGPDRA